MEPMVGTKGRAAGEEPSVKREKIGSEAPGTNREHTDAENSRAGHVGEGEQTQQVESLAKLAARAAEAYLIDARRRIPQDADDRIADRRSDLRGRIYSLECRLMKLDDEKEQDIQDRTKRLKEEQDEVLEQIAIAGGNDRYCNSCSKFYRTRPDAKGRCSVPKCCSYLNCLTCECQPLDGTERCGAQTRTYGGSEPKKRGSDTEDDDPNYHGQCFYENFPNVEGPGPSDNGYVECWICKATYCNHDFQKHYNKCRSKARGRCGFRPPTYYNEGERFICVPGHCGEEIKGEYYVCTEDDAWCCTVCCKKCVTICNNGYDARGDWDYNTLEHATSYYVVHRYGPRKFRHFGVGAAGLPSRPPRRRRRGAARRMKSEKREEAASCDSSQSVTTPLMLFPVPASSSWRCRSMPTVPSFPGLYLTSPLMMLMIKTMSSTLARSTDRAVSTGWYRKLSETPMFLTPT